MRTLNYECDLCVVGGGLAGMATAITAARKGIKTVLVHDRPVLGGNASEEMRMWICGAHGKDNRETGFLEELVLENYYRNPSVNYSLWSTVLYEKAMYQENLTTLLNTSCFDAEMDGSRIVSIRAWQSCAETFHVVKAKYFADCSGDSILAPLSGAEYMYGREGKTDFDETIPPDEADKKTMGMSCLMQARETDHKTTFTPPSWAYKYENDVPLNGRDHNINTNFWWIEIGGEADCIHDTDKCREELLKIALGVWDHMKNGGDHGADNWELDWIGFLPGKRESRRYVGKYIITQNDVESEGRFDDIVAYGGWSMDDHFPEGFYYTGGHPTIYHPAPSPWGIPLRALISRNIDNLVFAGRNISVTHAALSSSRVMATCAIMGQALGAAVAMAVKGGTKVEDVDVKKLQATLMDDDCFIPWHERSVSALTLSATTNAEIARNGKDRGEDNLWRGSSGDYIEYSFSEDVDISRIRLVFDSDLNRPYHNMPENYPMKQEGYELPKTLVKEYRIEAESRDGKVTAITEINNRQRLVLHNTALRASRIRLIPISTVGGNDDFRVFSFEIS